MVAIDEVAHEYEADGGGDVEEGDAESACQW